jgi:hypothetical protein
MELTSTIWKLCIVSGKRFSAKRYETPSIISPPFFLFLLFMLFLGVSEFYEIGTLFASV